MMSGAKYLAVVIAIYERISVYHSIEFQFMFVLFPVEVGYLLQVASVNLS